MARSTKIARPIALATLLALLLSLSTGCARVKPWERDALARREMSWNPDPLYNAMQGHVRFSKEASLPATTSGGGGCGCN
jgi:hypothetical protein